MPTCCVPVICLFITVPHQDNKSVVLAQYNSHAPNEYTTNDSKVDGGDEAKNIPPNICK